MKKALITEAKRLQELAGIITEADNRFSRNIIGQSDTGLRTAMEYGIPDYIDRDSVEYSEDEEGGWSLNFTMEVPKEDVMEMDVREANNYFAKELNANSYSGPGQSYSKSYIDVEEQDNMWMVSMTVDGGYDI